MKDVFIDITGKKYGKLTVISLDHKDDSKKRIKIYWLCQCDCGNTKIIEGNSLKSGNSNSCGCSKSKNMIGERFGRLLVTRFDHKDKCYHWLCLCDCGNTKVVRGTSLRNGVTKSCGCITKERSKKIYKERWKKSPMKPGESNFNSLYGSYKRNAIKRNLCFDISKQYFEKLIKQNCFYCNIEPTQNYKASGYLSKEYYYNGIDRKNNKIGYTEGNCLPCCGVCNKAKGTTDYLEFLEWIKKVSENVSLKNT